MEIFIHSLALGQLIQVLSLLLHVNSKTTIITPSLPFFSTLTCFKSIFNLSDDQLIIKQNELGPDNTYGNLGDHAKLLSPYIKPTQVTLFGKNFSTDKRNKPCIGIAMAKNALELKSLINHGVSSTESGQGDSRYHEFNIYEKIIKLALSSGYDVITLNIHNTTLEEKTYQISQQCDCVITYEGGMAHLAHCFDVPCIMLPWQQRFWMSVEDQHPLLDTTYGTPLSRAEIMHLDKSTYFLESADEILSWTPDDLCGVIKDLYNKKGNSKLLTKETVNSINSNIRGLDLLLMVGNTDDLTRRIINDHMSSYALGGYEEFNLFNSVV
jgi:hypothetical protein